MSSTAEQNKGVWTADRTIFHEWHYSTMQEVIDVQVGEVMAVKAEAILKSTAIGSCIAVAGCVPALKAGVLAHIMLPGKAPERENPENRNRYAVDAIETLITEMEKLGCKQEDIKITLAGGANVLNKPDDTLCQENAKTVVDILERKDVSVVARDLHGTQRRSLTLDVGRASVYCSRGGGKMKLLWSG